MHARGGAACLQERADAHHRAARADAGHERIGRQTHLRELRAHGAHLFLDPWSPLLP